MEKKNDFAEKIDPEDFALGTLAMDDKKLLRKIDWQILPIMFLTYFLQMIDKIAINYANVMGIQDDLGMSGNDFSWLATAFFIAYAIAEIPQGGSSPTVPSCEGSRSQRLLLGYYPLLLFGDKEFCRNSRTPRSPWLDGGAPSLTLYTSMWYTRAESTPRYGFWYCGLGVGQIVGGLISFAAQHASASLSFGGWRIMFVVIGAVNILVSLLVLFVLPETPSKAKFLTEEEKQRIFQRLNQDQAGVGEKVFRWSSILEVFADLQTWMLVLLTILITIPSGVITTFSSILIKGFGYDSKESALLNIPSGVVSIVSTMVSTYAISRGFSRWLAIDILLIPTLLGSCLMSFLPTSDKGGCLAGIYLVNTTVAPLALIYAWTGANFKGYTMKVSGAAIISMGFSIANIIGPQTFQAKDAPQYIPAKITLVAVNAAAILVSTGLRVMYGIRNSRADRFGAPARSSMEARQANKGNVQDFHDDKSFRYVY
ncbi:hypothetical protein N7448_005794 [Penicillium atrosanguineum]|nr:hypothetical protein N7448_005794 [Penicillium atrosanguineum]